MKSMAPPQTQMTMKRSTPRRILCSMLFEKWKGQKNILGTSGLASFFPSFVVYRRQPNNVFYSRAPAALQPFQNAARGIARQTSPFMVMNDIFWAGIEKYYMDRGVLRRKHSILKDRYAQRCATLCCSCQSSSMYLLLGRSLSWLCSGNRMKRWSASLVQLR